jgi:tetratricopeptide (TPR) repeat protein
MLNRFLTSRWFSLFDLACVAIGCLIWFFQPQVGWGPLLLALLPWILRLGSGHFPFRRTLFDLPLVIFLLTAAMGVWVSYNPPAAWAKFWLIIGSVLLYFALAGQPETNLGLVFGLVGVLGAAVALSVLFDSNLGNYHPDLNLVRELSREWEAIRPAGGVNALPPNVSGGILAGLLPFPLLLTNHLFRQNKILFGLATLLIVAVMSLALFLSSSRGAWIAIAGALSITLMWVGSRFVLRSFSRSIQFALTTSLLAILVLVIGFFITSSGGLSAALDRMPGLPSGASRVELALNTINLSADFPFTGGGLSAFSGLYSKYVLIIPYLFVEYSNFYLDIYLEQGLLGGLAMLIILLGSLLMTIAALSKIREAKREALFQIAVMAGLVVFTLHGLVDDALYGIQGTPLLFLVPGIGVALSHPNTPYPIASDDGMDRLTRRGLGRLLWGSVGLFFFAGAAFGLFVLRPGKASWFANLGSIYMAKAELYDFPSNSFDYLPEKEPIEQAKEYFNLSLAIDPWNQTANYRLGMMASQETNFQAAVPYLEVAYQGNVRHRGIQKLLGYNYAWTGQPDIAAQMLADIPEARQELEAYIWWWGANQRPDLAVYSESALQQLFLSQ